MKSFEKKNKLYKAEKEELGIQGAAKNIKRMKGDDQALYIWFNLDNSEKTALLVGYSWKKHPSFTV